ncbi:MAG: FecR family protein [Pseudomonadota bacterium]
MTRMQNPYPVQRYAWFILVLGVLMSFSAMAEPAGRLLFARGDVQLLRDGEPQRMVKRGDTIEVGDTLRTGEGAGAQLRLNDGAMVALRADTVYKIEAQNFDKESPERSSQAGELLRGGLRVITGAIGKERPAAVELNSPLATIGIRGTVYETIYIPPEGLPNLPDALPGQYVLVLKGRVSVTTSAGELTLGVGELGYVATDGAEPELRPDFSWLFERFTTLEGGSGGSIRLGSSGNSSNSDTISRVSGRHDPETGGIGDELTEIAMTLATETEATTAPQPSGPTAGPLALAVGSDSDSINVYQAVFESEPVTLGSLGELVSAQGGTGDFSTLEATALENWAESTTAGDSTISWGAYSGADVILGPTDPVGDFGRVQYITATQVLNTVDALPTTGSFTYNYAGGSGVTLTTNSSLTVDFASATMDVSLEGVNYEGAWTATNQSVGNFYSASGIDLNNSVLGAAGNINGRFVGGNADGAIALFWLQTSATGGSSFTGTAAFTR